MNGRSEREPAVLPLREKLRAATLQAILTAAEDVFADQGLHDAHMGDIAKRAGVAVGTLYNHFKDREALLEKLMQTRREGLLARVDACLKEHAHARFEEKLHALLTCILENLQEHRKYLSIVFQGEIGRYQATFPTACQLPGEAIKQLYVRVEKVIKQGTKEKQIRAEVADLAPLLFMGMVRAMVIRDVLTEGQQPLTAGVDRLLTCFLRGAGA